MAKVELKIGLKRWLLFFVFMFIVMMFIIKFLVEPNIAIVPLLLIILCAAAVIIGTLALSNYFFQRKIILGHEELQVIGYATKTIRYKDVEKIGVGGGGFTLYDSANNVVISNVYKDFPDAAAFLRSKLNFQGINIVLAGKEIPKSI